MVVFVDDEYDVDGIKRIIQVLHAHTWPNLVMKGWFLLPFIESRICQ